MNFPRYISALLSIALVAGCMGCGWSSSASRKNTMTGISESGYPKGNSADPESPALGTMEKPGKEKKPEEKK